jgi:serine/threonine-protein kinase
MQVLLLQRKFTEVLQRGATLRDDVLASDSEKLIGKYGMTGIAKKVTGDEAGAREALLKAKELAQKYVSEAPEDFKRHGRLAEILAWLGEKEAAITEAKRGTELLPESVDAFDGPVATQTLAEIYVTVGEYDQALPLIDGLLSRPSSVTVEFLKLHPMFDAIRNDPRFVALLKKHGG